MLGLAKTLDPTYGSFGSPERTMRYRRVIAPGATFFFTLVTEQRRPLFREPEAVALFLESVEKVRSRHPFEVDAYVILPDHPHTIWTLPEGDTNFSTRWRLIKE